MSEYRPGLGVTMGVWADDQIRRIERTLDELANAPITLEECERLERALVRGHARNLRRLRDEYGIEEQGL